MHGVGSPPGDMKITIMINITTVIAMIWPILSCRNSGRGLDIYNTPKNILNNTFISIKIQTPITTPMLNLKRTSIQGFIFSRH